VVIGSRLIQLLESGPTRQSLPAVEGFLREIRQALDAM
jgi:tryptophan synthase alpha subunit